jgi:hypothetical protein
LIIINKWLIGGKLSIMTQGTHPLFLCKALMCAHSLKFFRQALINQAPAMRQR